MPRRPRSAVPAVPEPLSAPLPAPLFEHRNLPLLLLQARERIIGRFRPVLRAHGLTEQQWRILRVVVERPLEPREIVQCCGVSSPSLAGILTRMEGLGLVTRTRLSTDQRRVLVTPTARSRALARRMASSIEAVYRAIEADIGPDHSRELYRILDHVLDRLPEPEPGFPED